MIPLDFVMFAIFFTLLTAVVVLRMVRRGLPTWTWTALIVGLSGFLVVAYYGTRLADKAGDEARVVIGLNNYAMAALSMLERSAKHLPDALREDHLDALKDMRDGLSRMSEITGSLRKFAHPERGNPVEVQVNDSVRTALRLMAAEIKDGIVAPNNIPDELTVVAAASVGNPFVDWRGIAFDGSHGTHTKIVDTKAFVNPTADGRYFTRSIHATIHRLHGGLSR